MYVDPLYGDDALASAQNPPAGVGFLAFHNDPGDPPIFDPPVKGVLTHAPYSFRTLTGAQGAIAYVNAFLTPLPRQFGNLVVEAVVIHCLPGLYGPRLNGQTREIDSRNGLPWNGEQFPVLLPHGVTLRGASALDTILDARGQRLNVIEVEVPIGQDLFKTTLITQLTIRGAHTPSVVGGTLQVGSALEGAGVLVHGQGRAQITISNCYVVGNYVGIGVDAEVSNPPEQGEVEHRVVVVNNTIAWNTIGLWNGNTRAQPSVGESETILVNNLFDFWGPPGYPSGYSDFEGVSLVDTLITQVRDVGTGNAIADFAALYPGGGYDSNAYSGILINRGNMVPFSVWPYTAPRAGNPTPLPELDTTLLGLTPPVVGPVRSSVIYVADAMRLNPSIPEDSPHDMRLSPRARTLDIGGQSTWFDSPFVDRGLQTESAGSPNGELVINGSAFPDPSTAGKSWGPDGTMDAKPSLRFWDWDAEGFGNPRFEPKAGYGVPPAPFPASAQRFATIDVGADEAGGLLIAGYVPDTRILTAYIPFAPAHTPHDRIYFFNYQPGAPTQQFPRPEMNVLVGGRWPSVGTAVVFQPYWAHVQDGTGSISPVVNYTEGVAAFGFDSERRRRVLVEGRLPFMRNLACDLSPHLLMDWHPQWMTLWAGEGAPPTDFDIYATHPWFESPDLGERDNPFLFSNSPMRNFGTSQAWLSIPAHHETVGIVNPPGTEGPAVDLSSWPTWLGAYPTFPFGPFAPCQSPAGIYTVDSTTGIGDIGPSCPDRIPGIVEWSGLGIRINCERRVNGIKQTNLQSFLMVLSAAPGTLSAEQRQRSMGDGGIDAEALGGAQRWRGGRR